MEDHPFVFTAIFTTNADAGGSDTVYGNAGDDIILGQQGGDHLFGNEEMTTSSAVITWKVDMMVTMKSMAAAAMIAGGRQCQCCVGVII